MVFAFQTKHLHLGEKQHHGTELLALKRFPDHRTHHEHDPRRGFAYSPKLLGKHFLALLGDTSLAHYAGAVNVFDDAVFLPQPV